MQTLEAIINENGNIELLDEIRLKKRSRALVTVLDEEPKVSNREKREKLFEVFKKMQKADLFKKIDDPVEWQKNLRDEWE
jgi:hypothetical protein